MIDSMTSARERIGKLDIDDRRRVSASLGLLRCMTFHVDDDIQRERWAVVPFPLVTVPLLWRRSAPLAALGGRLAGARCARSALRRRRRALRLLVLPTAFLLVFSAGARLRAREALIGLGARARIDPRRGPDRPTAGSPSSLMPARDGASGASGASCARARAVGRELEARTASCARRATSARGSRSPTERARLSARARRAAAAPPRRAGADGRRRRRARATPATATATLAEIERESRRTLEEMRAVVGVLRDDDADAPIGAAADADAPRGAAGARQGRRRAADRRGQPARAAGRRRAVRLPDRRAPARRRSTTRPDVEVRVRFRDDALELAVSGPARRAGEGRRSSARASACELHHGHARRDRRAAAAPRPWSRCRCSRRSDVARRGAVDVLVGLAGAACRRRLATHSQEHGALTRLGGSAARRRARRPRAATPARRGWSRPAALC